MNRKERRELIRNNKDFASTCPNCGKTSLFATDKEHNVRCMLCGHVMPVKQKPEKQCFVKFN